jgi:hypothetical protein
MNTTKESPLAIRCEHCGQLHNNIDSRWLFSELQYSFYCGEQKQKGVIKRDSKAIPFLMRCECGQLHEVKKLRPMQREESDKPDAFWYGTAYSCFCNTVNQDQVQYEAFYINAKKWAEDLKAEGRDLAKELEELSAKEWLEDKMRDKDSEPEDTNE